MCLANKTRDSANQGKRCIFRYKIMGSKEESEVADFFVFSRTVAYPKNTKKPATSASSFDPHNDLLLPCLKSTVTALGLLLGLGILKHKYS